MLGKQVLIIIISLSVVGSLPKCAIMWYWYGLVSTVSNQPPIDWWVVFDPLEYLIDPWVSILTPLEAPDVK